MSSIKDSAAALITRLAAAEDKTVRITDPDDETRASYRRRIHAAKQYGLVPDGTVLRHTGRNGGDLVIRLLEANNPDETDWNRVRLNLRRPTRAGQDLGTLLAENPAAISGVSAGQRDRAIAFLLALDAEGGEHGHQVKLARRGQYAKLGYVIGGSQKTLELSEEYDEVPRPPSRGRRTYSWQPYSTERVASGRLRLVIGRTGHQSHDTWVDKGQATLEKKIRTIVKEAQAGFDADEVKRLEQERRWAEQQAEWKRQQEAARLAQEKKEAETRLAWQAALDEARPKAVAAVHHSTLAAALQAWRDARDLREICAILEASASEADRTGDKTLADNLRNWCANGIALADQVDPTTMPASLGDIPYDREPTSAELRPFMNDWSPDAPRKEDGEQRSPKPPRAGPDAWELSRSKPWYPGRKSWW